MNNTDELKHEVRDHYTAVANGAQGSCCDGVCGCEAELTLSESYAGLEGYVPEADLGLGCGIPTSAVELRPGDTVLDLGSGAGNDCFVARRLVGETGRVIGVDFTPAMIRKAEANAQRLGYTNVDFIRGEIEDLPVANASVDVIVSNCVINLVPDKAKAFAEMFRVLRPGGRFGISDVVLDGDLPPSIRQVARLYAACVSGAIAKDEYLDLLRNAGFENVEIRKARASELPEEFLRANLSEQDVLAVRESGVRIVSINVHGRKPV